MFRRTLTNAGVALAVIACALIAAVVGWELGRPASHSGPKPATVLHQAAAAMETVSSYQFSGQVSIGAEVLNVAGEFSAPDRLHETLTLGGTTTVERVLIGTTTYQRSGSTWAKVASAATSGDPRTTFGALGGVTDVSVNGEVYSFTATGANAAALVTGADSAITITGTVTVQAGRIVNLSYRTAAGAGTSVRFTYSGLNTTPPVTVPPGVA